MPGIADARALATSRLTAYWVAAGVGGLANLALVPVWLAMFGPPVYGRYAVTWAVAIACGAGFAGWIRQAALRTSGTADRLANLPVWSVLLPVALAGASCAGISSVLGTLRGMESLAGAVLASATVVGQLVTTVLQRDDRGWAFAGSELAKVVGTIAATLGLHHLAEVPGHLALILGLAGGHVTLLALPGLFSGLVLANSRNVLRDWWRYGWPLSAWLTLAPALLYADRIILQLFASPETVGSFAAVSDVVVRGVAAAAAPLVTAGHIRSMRWHNQGRREEVVRSVKRLRAGLLWATLALVLVVTALNKPLAEVIGSTALPWVCLPLIALGAGLWQVALFAHKPLEIGGRTGQMLAMLGAAVMVEVLTCLVLVPSYGATGAAIGLVVGVSSYVVAVSVRTRRRWA